MSYVATVQIPGNTVEAVSISSRYDSSLGVVLTTLYIKQSTTSPSIVTVVDRFATQN